MKRKVIQLNPTTLAVTLPKKWTEKNSIAKGDELFCVEKGSGVVFEHRIAGILRKVKIDFSKQCFEKNYISSLYQSGVDEIEVVYSDPAIIPVIKDHIAKYLIGFDVVEERKNTLLIKSIATDISIDFDNLYKKNMQIMCQMIWEIEAAMRKKDYSALRATRSLEEHENKIQSLCLRYISKKGFPENPFAEKAAYDLVREIENICDCMKRICDTLPTESKKITPQIAAFTKEVALFVESFYALYYANKAGSGDTFFNKGKSILAKGFSLLSQGVTPLLVHHLIDIVTRTYFLSHQYFEIKTDLFSHF